MTNTQDTDVITPLSPSKAVGGRFSSAFRRRKPKGLGDRSRPIAWVPSLYFAEALPYVAVMTLSVIMYTNLGLTNTEIALYTSWLYLPWVIKPIWSPIIDALRTKRWWVLVMELLVGASLAGVALTLQMALWLRLTLACFWLMAFASATHDIAADGMYILGLSEKDQAFYVGWRSTFYRIGTIFCQGVLVVMAGYLEKAYNVPLAWTITMGLLAGIMIVLALWHTVALPKTPSEPPSLPPTGDRNPQGGENKECTEEEDSGINIIGAFGDSLRAFVSKPHIITATLFMLLFRFPEAQLAKMAQPFMLRTAQEGGLGLETATIGFAYGTLGVIGLLAGGIIGGWLASRDGLKRWWWPMIMAISLPDAVYIYLSICQPTDIWIVDLCVFVEQLGYGFGFTAYMLFMVYFAKGEKSTSVFSICTALQALGMMIPGMFAGWMADSLGFVNFFVWVMVCCLVTFAVSAMVKLKPSETGHL